MAKPPMDASLVGKFISVIWPANREYCECQVIGCRKTKGVAKNKVFYLEDESTEAIELAERIWKMGGTKPSRLVGKRIYFYWEAEYNDGRTQKKAEDFFGKGNTKIPYECFVVKLHGPDSYRILYTLDG